MTEEQKARRLKTRKGGSDSVVSFRMNDELRDAAQEKARKQRKSFALYIEEALEEKMGREATNDN